MKRIVILITVAFILAQGIKAQAILPILSKLYFDADIKKFDTSLISFFKKDHRLAYFSFDNILIQGRKESYGNDEDFYKFSFKRHPFLNPDSLSGYIFIYTRKIDKVEKIISLSLNFDKLNEPKADSVFALLATNFTAYYSKLKTEIKAGTNRSDIKGFFFDTFKMEAFVLKKQVSADKEFEVSFELSNQ